MFDDKIQIGDLVRITAPTNSGMLRVGDTASVERMDPKCPAGLYYKLCRNGVYDWAGAVEPLGPHRENEMKIGDYNDKLVEEACIASAKMSECGDGWLVIGGRLCLVQLNHAETHASIDWYKLESERVVKLDDEDE